MRLLKAFLLSAMSALLMAMAIPNDLFEFGNPLLGLVAIAPLYVALYFTKKHREAFFVTAFFGALTHGLTSYWLWFFNDFRFWTLGVTIIAYWLISGIFGLYIKTAIQRGGLLAPVLFAFAWAIGEWAKSTGFLAYPWGLVAYSWNTILPAIQLASITGVYGISAVLVFVSASLAELFLALSTSYSIKPLHLDSPKYFGFSLMPARRFGYYGFVHAVKQLLISLVLVMVVIAYGFISLGRDRSPKAYINAVMVQANTDSWNSTEASNLKAYIGLARKAINKDVKPDAIIFSETALYRPWKLFEDFYNNFPQDYSLGKLLEDNSTYLITGLPNILDYEAQEASNSVALISPNSEQLDIYNKMHPVPFAESIPFWEFAVFRNFMKNTVGLSSGWVMGSRYTIFKLNTANAGVVSFGAPICFEDAFADLCRQFVLDGSELLINLTNDSWALKKSAEIQHFVAAKFRAIELRRTLVRSTNGGVSAIVDANGRILESFPLFESYSKQVKIPIYTAEKSVYLCCGDWFVVTVAIFVGLCMIIIYINDFMARKKLWKY